MLMKVCYPVTVIAVTDAQEQITYHSEISESK